MDEQPTKHFINDPVFASLRRWNHEEVGVEVEPPSLDMTIAAMDQAGVAKGLISSWQNQQGVLISNQEVADCVARYPDRLVGIASAPLTRPVEAVKELKHWVQNHVFKGLQIVQWHWNLPPTHAYYYPLYATCVELGVPVCLQVGHTGPLMPSEVGRPIPYIDQVALDFPDLNIVCGHIGYPWTTEMIAVATKHRNVYIDTSAYTTRRYPRELVEYLKAHGSHKVLFGTNYPMITPAKCLKHLELLDLDSDTQDRFLFKNALEVFGLDF